MTQVGYSKSLREGHERAGRALAERECLRLAGNFPTGEDAAATYLSGIQDVLRRAIREVHAEHGVKEDMDTLMLVYAATAFTERFLELTGMADFPFEPANAN